MTELAMVVSALGPDLTLIAIGIVLGRFIDSCHWAELDKLNFYIFFPALMFTAAASHPIDLNQIVSLGASVWILMAIGLALAWPLKLVGPPSYLDFAGVWQTAWRFNAGLGFVLVQVLPQEASSIMAIAIGLAVPLANIFAVGVLARGSQQQVGSIILAIVTNPFFLASSLGLIVSNFDQDLPSIPMQALERLADVAIPIALLSIGGTLKWKMMSKLSSLSYGLHLIKLVLLPLFSLGVAEILIFDNTSKSVIVLFAALPTAAAAQTLAARFGADRILPAVIIAQSTILACLTIPFWLLLIV